MKSPQLKDIPTPDQASFTQRVKTAKKSIHAKAGEKISVSLHPDHIAYIHKMALTLGAERGKNVSASEALRRIIDTHKDQS